MEQLGIINGSVFFCTTIHSQENVFDCTKMSEASEDKEHQFQACNRTAEKGTWSESQGKLLDFQFPNLMDTVFLYKMRKR